MADPGPSDGRLTELVQAELGRELRRHGGWTIDAPLRPLGAGRSAVTLATTMDRPGSESVDIVARAELRDADGIALIDSNEQFSVLELARRHGVLAPQPLHVFSVDSADGPVSVLITERIEGEVPDPWQSAGRRAIAELRDDATFRGQFVEQLARIHDVPLSALPSTMEVTDEAGAARSYPGRVLERSATYLRTNPGFRHDPVLAYAHAWLAEHRPPDGFSDGLIHGDFRMGNIVVADRRLVGVLDWELAEAGDVLADLAWLHGPQGRTQGRVAGLYEDDELVAAYAALSGTVVPPALVRYYTTFGTFRTALIWVTLASWSALLSGDPGALRAFLSVGQLKGLLSGVLFGADGAPPSYGRQRGATAHRATDAALRAGMSKLSQLLAATLRPGSQGGAGAAGSSGLAVRGARAFLDGLGNLLAGDEYFHYDAAVRDLVATSGGGSKTAESSWPGALLADEIARGGPQLWTRDPGRTFELERLVRWSATPNVGFGDLLCAIGVATSPADLDLGGPRGVTSR